MRWVLLSMPCSVRVCKEMRRAAEMAVEMAVERSGSEGRSDRRYLPRLV